jgi:cell division protease FtsH
MKLGGNQKNETGSTVKKERNKKPFNFFWVIFLGMNVIIISYFIFGGTSNPMAISWKEFSEDLLKNGDVQKVMVVDKSKVEVYLTPSALKKDKYKHIDFVTALASYHNNGHIRNEETKYVLKIRKALRNETN